MSIDLLIDTVRIQARIAEFVDTDPSGKGHSCLGGEDAVASASNSAHDDQSGTGGHVANTVRVALRGDRRKKKAAEPFRLHIELNKRW